MNEKIKNKCKYYLLYMLEILIFPLVSMRNINFLL